VVKDGDSVICREKLFAAALDYKTQSNAKTEIRKTREAALRDGTEY